MTDKVINLTNHSRGKFKGKGVPKGLSHLPNKVYDSFSKMSAEQIANHANGYGVAVLGRFETYQTALIEKFLPSDCKALYVPDLY